MLKWLREKLNPAQPLIAGDSGDTSPREPTVKYNSAYKTIPKLQRGINMLVDDAVQIPIKLSDTTSFKQTAPVSDDVLKRSGIERVLNIEPNPYEDIVSFRTKIFMDLILQGNAFIYFDGDYLYHLPARNVTVKPSDTTLVDSYTYSAHPTPFSPREIIHIKEPNPESLFIGRSRLFSATDHINSYLSMKKFQKTFFDNNAVPGLVLKTQNVLGPKIKERTILAWKTKYNPRSGGRSPIILDGGMEVDALSTVNFKELDFEESIKAAEDSMLEAIGIPPILMTGGNNANIRPNHRLYYLETVLPLVRKVVRGFERFFGVEMWEDVVDIPALQPELRELAAYLSTLTNGGIIVVDEARRDLGYPALKPEQGEGNKIRVPQNIAGSATNPAEGGRPSEDTD